MQINKKYSFQSFTNRKFTDVDPAEFNNSIIKGSSFYQEGGWATDVFPKGMKGVRFEECNLDNAEVPEGNEMCAYCSNRYILAGDDGKDWIFDDDDKPVESI